MQYVCLDLEWNTAKIPDTDRHINEIIEFGAVLLDESFEEQSRFQCFVRSALTRSLNSLVRKLTHITNEQMRSGTSFAQALSDFQNWMPSDCVILTWSNTDLYTLANNCIYFLGEINLPKFHWYVDLQRYVGQALHLENGQQIALGNAAIMMGIDVDSLPLHRADEDSRLCGILLKQTYDSKRFHAAMQDMQHPEFFRRLTFRSYSITDPKDPAISPKDLEVECPNCHVPAALEGNYSSQSKAIMGRFVCPSCHETYLLIARFKQRYDHVRVKRTIRLIPPKPQEEPDPLGKTDRSSPTADKCDSRINP